LWVKDDYTGFDVKGSKEWSRKWTFTIDGTAKGTDKSWQQQLKDFGMI